jgi:hypothetical protein
MTNNDDPLDDRTEQQQDEGSDEATIGDVTDSVRSVLAGVRERTKPVTARMHSGARTRKAKATVFLAMLAAMAIGVLYLSVQLAGIVSTLVYATLFAVSAAAVPTIIGLFGASVGRSLSTILGRLHFILGQFAFGHGYLVQTEDGWNMHPGREDAVWIDGEWREIEGGQSNRSVLGWQPFAILREKTDATLSEARVDARSARDTKTDGGQEVTRAGYQEVKKPLKTGLDGEWVVDLKRVFSDSLQRIGDIKIIETAEEIVMADENSSSSFGDWGPIVSGTLGLIVGVVTGYVMLGGA